MTEDTAVRVEHNQSAVPSTAPLVSIGLPVRNGARTLASAVQSVLSQDYERLELVISDNASTDETEELCRELACADKRIVYHRQVTNVGLLRNFVQTLSLAKGTFFRWMGDDDWMAPSYVSRCLEVFRADSRLILVTTQQSYVRPDGSTYAVEFSDKDFYSDDPIHRFEKLIAYIVSGAVPVDPLYGMARRSSLARIERRNMIREDEIFALMLTLAGPWGDVPEVLARRQMRDYGVAATARYLGVPMWQAHIPTIVECWELLRLLQAEQITPSQRRRARIALGRLFVGRHYRTLTHRVGRLVGLVRPAALAS